MSRRRPSFAERRLRSDLWHFLRRNVQVLAVFAGIVCAAVIPISFVASGYLLGLVHGIAVATAVLAVWQLFLIHGGHMFRLSGVWGEDNTRDVLRSAKRRGLIYGWIDNLEIEGGDVDHLVVAPWGVIAIDSKWHTGAFDQVSLQRDCDRTLAATRRARSILRSLNRSTEVIPVVAIWGAQQAEVPTEGTQCEGVAVLRGRGIRRWLRDQRWREEACSVTEAGSLLSELQEFQVRVRPK
jgi:hypothetical protein